MTKEQEEAIDRINKSYDDNTGYYDASGRDWITILNLINHLEEENEYMHKELDRQEVTINNYAKEIEKKDEELEMYKDIKEIVNSKVTDLAKLKQYDDLKEENRKKDKMIDLMAEELQKHIYVLYDGDTITSKKGIIQHFERKLEKQ